MISAVRGVQEPRIYNIPDYSSSAGREAVELAAMAGLVLDPWQAFVLEHSLGERADGSWASFEVAMVMPRQNGKDAVIEARELAGLFLLGENLIIHSAHQFDTSLEHFTRLLHLIDSTYDLSCRVRRVSRSHGEEGIQLLSGQRIRFRTRTAGGGRGFSGDCLILNEAMILPEASIAALLPTLSARPNPQVWYAGSPVDQMIHDHGVALARLRERAVRGDDRLSYFEWSLDQPNPEDVRREVAMSEESWAQSNPGLGIRISSEHVSVEQRSMAPRTFAVERLGVGDWPRTDGLDDTVISPDEWYALADPGSQSQDPVCLAFDVKPDRSMSTVAAAGRRADGLAHVEVIEHRHGTGWVVQRVVELVERHKPSGVIVDKAGPAGSLIPMLEAAGVIVTVVTAQQYAQACGMLLDKVGEKTVRHLGSRELEDAIRGASTRPLGESWAWSRKSSRVDISPLVASTLALYGLETQIAKNWEPVMAWV